MGFNTNGLLKKIVRQPSKWKSSAGTLHVLGGCGLCGRGNISNVLMLVRDVLFQTKLPCQPSHFCIKITEFDLFHSENNSRG